MASIISPHDTLLKRKIEHTNMNVTNELRPQSATEETYRRIGQGFCGTLWAATVEPRQAYAYKREDGGPGRSLHNDYIMHRKVLESLSLNGSRIGVTGCHQFIYNNDQIWWDEQVLKFPNDFQIRCKILITDRITPFPKEVRDSIIDLYCPESLKSLIKLSKPDEDCLIRPYLGPRRRLEKQSRFQAFSLRNYPLHIDQIEALCQDGVLYAKIMAETLANPYWRAHIDGNDVEFVLAPAYSQFGERPTNPTAIKSPILGDHVMWILDFDCCREITINRSGVEQAARAFLKNDLFYPHPGRENTKDELLWKSFKGHFVEASEAVLGRGSARRITKNIPQMRG